MTLSKMIVATGFVAISLYAIAAAYGSLATSFGPDIAVMLLVVMGIPVSALGFLAIGVKVAGDAQRRAMEHTEYIHADNTRTVRTLAPSYRAVERHHLVDAQTQLAAMRIAAREAKQLPVEEREDPVFLPLPKKRTIEFL